MIMKCEDNWNAKKGMNVITLPVLVIGVYPGNRDSVHVPRDSGPTLLEVAGQAYKPLHSPVYTMITVTGRQPLHFCLL